MARLKIRPTQIGRLLWIFCLLFLGIGICCIIIKFYIGAIFALIVSLFLWPPFRNFLKRHHYNKNALIGIPIIAFLAFVISVYLSMPSEEDIPDHLKEFTYISGTKVDSYEDMSYLIDPELKAIKENGNYVYYPVANEPIPVMIVSKETDMKIGSIQSFVESEAEKQLDVQGEASNVLQETMYANNRECILATYTFTVDSKTNFLSSKLNGETFIAPIENDVFVISFFTYTTDFNEYGFTTMLDSVDLYNITHILDVRESMETYLKDHGCPEGGFASECEEFEKYRKKLRDLIPSGTVEEMEAAKEEAIRYENSIKARIQKDAADQAYLKSIGIIE